MRGSLRLSALALGLLACTPKGTGADHDCGCEDPHRDLNALEVGTPIDKIISTLESSGELAESMIYRLKRNELAALTHQTITEKEIKEVIQFYRKREDYPTYVEAVKGFTRLLDQSQNAHKSYDQILDLMKRGNKRLEQGGYYLLYRAVVLGNEVFEAETHKPGISWMVELLDEYFDHLKEVINMVIEHKDEIGPSLVEFFRRAYLNFAPISHFNIKVYFMYQLYSLKFIRLGTEQFGDTMGMELTDQLIGQFENDNNPLSFIKADWEEFKEEALAKHQQ